MKTIEASTNRRDYYTQYLEELLSPIKPFFELGIKFGDIESMNGEQISWFEMFARSMYGITAYTAVVGDNEYVQIFNELIHKIIADYKYKDFKDYDQKCVELIPIALMLYLHKGLTWDTYSERQQEAIVSYLENINTHKLVSNNWQFFKVIVCGILNKLTGNKYTECVQWSWRLIDECYAGEGWYRDGINGPKDYYIAWGYHFYSLLHQYLFPDLTERNSIIEERVKHFANDFKQLFDNKGRMVPYGRSLIYRFASLSFWSVYLLTGHKEVENEYILNLIDNSLAWWRNQEIATNGILNVGYAYRNDFICENYSTSGSVYWALKFFLILLLDKSNSLWKNRKEETNRQENGIYTIANGDIVIDRNTNWNIAYFNSYCGSPISQSGAKYMRFAYNSACGFNFTKNHLDFSRLSDDSSLVFNIAGVNHQKTKNNSFQNQNGVLASEWDCGNLIYVKSYVIPTHGSYFRVHCINSKINCTCYESGFAIEANRIVITNCKDSISISNGEYESKMHCYVRSGKLLNFENECGSNIYHRHTYMPCIRYLIHIGFNLLIDRTSFSDQVGEYATSNDNVILKKGINSITLNLNDVSHRINYGLINASLMAGWEIASRIKHFIHKFVQ